MSWMKTPKASLSSLGEPAHMVQWYVGLLQRDNTTPVTGRQLDAVLRLIATRFGDHTSMDGKGRWRDPDSGKLFNEPSMIFTAYRVETRERGCGALRSRAKAAAAQAARAANQKAVLVVTTCADGHREVDFVPAARR